MGKNIVIVLVIALCGIGCGCQQFAMSLRKNIKPTSFAGKIKDRFLDSLDRMSPKIILESGNIYPIYAYEMFELLDAGDSIIKKKGSLKYIHIKPRLSRTEYYPICDNKKIK